MCVCKAPVQKPLQQRNAAQIDAPQLDADVSLKGVRIGGLDKIEGPEVP